MAKFAICTSAILHLVCPKNFSLAICLQFPGKTVISRRDDKQRLWQLKGANEVSYGRCANGKLKNFNIK